MEESFKTTPPTAGQARAGGSEAISFDYIYTSEPTSSSGCSLGKLGILTRPKPDDSRRGGSELEEGANAAPDAGQPSAVRFSSAIQEIEPRESLVAMTTSTNEADQASQPLDAEAQEVRSVLSQSLQRHRTNNFSFEPVSLPVSRVRLDLSYSLGASGSCR